VSATDTAHAVTPLCYVTIARFHVHLWFSVCFPVCRKRWSEMFDRNTTAATYSKMRVWSRSRSNFGWPDPGTRVLVPRPEFAGQASYTMCSNAMVSNGAIHAWSKNFKIF